VLVVALIAAHSGTTAHAQTPTSAADQFGTGVAASLTDLARTSFGGPIYLSDAIPSSVINGYGPLEADTSNGEALVGDGEAITLNGVSYLRGLGTRAASRVSYALPADCNGSFKASVGVDDEVGPTGSVVFRVFADTTKVYDSALMTGKSQTQNIDVPLGGADQLQLVVTKGGDDGAYDHADWADARVECDRNSTSYIEHGVGSGGYPGASLLGPILIASAICITGLRLRRRESPN
jgi:hypothetical protein